MSTLPIRASHIPEVWPLPSLSRVTSFLSSVLDVFAEAQEMASAAHKRYPIAVE
jgi:hypothetical protein